MNGQKELRVGKLKSPGTERHFIAMNRADINSFANDEVFASVQPNKFNLFLPRIHLTRRREPIEGIPTHIQKLPQSTKPIKSQRYAREPIFEMIKKLSTSNNELSFPICIKTLKPALSHNPDLFSDKSSKKFRFVSTLNLNNQH